MRTVAWKTLTYLQKLSVCSVPGKLLRTFVAQTLYTLVKRSPLKCRFWDYQVLGQNLENSLCRFSKLKSVPLRILHHSSVLWHNSSVFFFGSNIIYVRQKQHIKVQTFRLACKIDEVHHVIFGTKSLFFKLQTLHDWGVVQNLKKNWIAVWKMTWEIW